MTTEQEDREIANKMSECGISQYYWRGHSLPSLGPAGAQMRQYIEIMEVDSRRGVFVFGRRRERQLALQVFAKELVLNGQSTFVCNLLQYNAILQALANGDQEHHWVTIVPNLCVVNFYQTGERWFSRREAAVLEDSFSARAEGGLATHLSADAAFAQCDWWTQSFRTFMEPHIQSFSFGV